MAIGFAILLAAPVYGVTASFFSNLLDSSVEPLLMFIMALAAFFALVLVENFGASKSLHSLAFLIAIYSFVAVHITLAGLAAWLAFYLRKPPHLCPPIMPMRPSLPVHLRAAATTLMQFAAACLALEPAAVCPDALFPAVAACTFWLAAMDLRVLAARKAYGTARLDPVWGKAGVLFAAVLCDGALTDWCAGRAPAWGKWVAIAAALVFVVGGTDFTIVVALASKW
jgi:hypothetical protein